MAETFTFRMRINLIDYLNRYISLINEINSLKEEIDAVEEAEDEIINIGYKLERITDRLFAEDTGAQIIAGYMEDIAKRAIELNDEKLLELLQGLDVVSKKEEKEK